MNILICSDGTPASDGAAHLGGMLARVTKAPVTLLGIVENPADDQPLRQALDRETDILAANWRRFGTSSKPASRLRRFSAKHLPGSTISSSSARAARTISGIFGNRSAPTKSSKQLNRRCWWRSATHERLSRILLCSGGKRFIDDAVRLTATLAAALHAEVTLFHIMAEPPAIVRSSHRTGGRRGLLCSLPARNLVVIWSAEKKALEKLGVAVKIRIRHGFIIDQLLDEMREGNYDLIVSGSSRARGPLRHYIMGDVTHRILDSAECSVLIARSQPQGPAKGLWQSMARLFR